MAQAVFDFTERFTGQEHTNRTGVAEAVSRVDIPETFGDSAHNEDIFLQIRLMPCRVNDVPPLIDEQVSLI